MRETVAAVLALVASSAWLIGCSNNSPTRSTILPVAMQTVPREGERAYDPSASIYIKFSQPADSSIFYENFFCINSAMHQALHDSLSNGMMGGGMMGNSMMEDGTMGRGGQSCNSTQFTRRLHERAVRGRVWWNDRADSCIFTPDSALMHDQDYVLMLGSGMGRSHGGQTHRSDDAPTQDVIITLFETSVAVNGPDPWSIQRDRRTNQWFRRSRLSRDPAPAATARVSPRH